MKILGLNVFHADTSAAIIVNGKIKWAIEEERLNRIKHTDKFPINAIKFCLKKEKLTINDIDFIAVNYNRYYNWNKKLNFALNFFSFERGLKFSNKIILEHLEKEFKINIKAKIINVPHHLAHISSSYFTSGLNKSNGLTIDGSGDFSTLELYHCKNNNIRIVNKINYPNSLGLLYQAVSQFLGFTKYGDEYKVMALAALGKPKYINQFKKFFLFDPPYNFNLNLKIYKKIFFKKIYETKDIIYSKRFLEKFFGKERKPSEPILKRHKDIACSLQFFFEDISLKIIRNIFIENYSNNICVSGGCFFNSVLNGKIINKLNFSKVFLHSNCGDAGGSLGAALYVYYKKNNKSKKKKYSNNYLGSYYNNNEVEKSIIENKKLLVNFIFFKIESFNKINYLVSRALNEGKIVGWFQGRSEWGPRALGNRSILADPSIKNIKNIINKKIKLREPFRPFACSILEKKAYKYFYINNKSVHTDLSNMNFVFPAKKITSRKFPAIVHGDGSSRIQTVNYKKNKKFFNLINTFYKKYKKPLLLNTSLNINNPICDSPDDVIKTFYNTGIDLIVMQNFIIINKKLNKFYKNIKNK